MADDAEWYEDENTASLLTAMGWAPPDKIALQAVLAKRLGALREAQAAHGDDSIHTAGALYKVAETHTELWQSDQAYPYYYKAYTVAKAHWGAEHPNMYGIMLRTGACLVQLKRFGEAMYVYNEAHAIGVASDPIQAAGAQTQIGQLFFVTREFDRSLLAHEDALALLEEHRGPAHADTIAIRSRIAQIHSESREYALAAAARLEIAKLLEKHRGPGHSETTDARLAAARALLPVRRYTDAIALEEAALSHQVAAGEPNPSALRQTLYTRSIMADRIDDSGEHTHAIATLERSVALFEQTPHAAPDELSHTLCILGRLQHVLGNYPEALAYYRRALDAQEDSGADLETPLLGVGRALTTLGQPDTAVPFLARAQAIAEGLWGTDDDHTTLSILRIGEAHAAAGRHVEALAAFRRVMACKESSEDTSIDGEFAVDEPAPASVASLHAAIALSLSAQGEHDAALPHHQRALETARAGVGTWHPELPRFAVQLGEALDARGDHAQAIAGLQATIEELGSYFSPQHLAPNIVRLALGRLLLRNGDEDGAAAVEAAEAVLRPLLSSQHPAW